MQLEIELKKICEQKLSIHFSKTVKITGTTPIRGGSINQAVKATTSVGDFFIKWNDRKKYPAMFEKEKAGLELLFLHSILRTPQIIATDETEDRSFIIIENIPKGKPSLNFWVTFGEGLASLHKVNAPSFGLEYDNYIGSLPQNNKQHNKWVDFFIEERLEPQLCLALNNHLIEADFIKKTQKIYNLLPGIFPEEKPSLLHGDLWSGNFVIDENGNPVLIDPAVYYGHREAELAFTKLFGGFNEKFYAAYNQAFPLEKDFNNRHEIYNLYPLLVHLNLFGAQYLKPIKDILNKIR